MSLYNRPAYTKQVLDALVRCKGIEEYKLLIHIDPGCAEVVKIAEACPLNKQIILNQTRLGCSENILKALSHGFAYADFVIHCEDDILYAPDALKYFEFMNAKFKDDKTIFSISSYRRDPCPKEEFYSYLKWPWFVPWGWGTWRDRFEEMEATFRSSKHNPAYCWDECVNHEARGDRFEIYPALARSQNIGELGGAHQSPQCWANVSKNTFGSWLPELDIKTDQPFTPIL